MHREPKPVEIEALALSKDAATLEISFPYGASGVSLKIYGLDGLEVSKAGQLDKNAYQPGDKTTIQIAFRAGPGESRVVAQVRGEVRGRPRSRAVSFAVGTPSEQQKRERTQGVEVDSEGRPVRVTPAKRG